MTTDTALNLAETIVADGFDSFDSELAALLEEARRAAVNPVIVDVAGDTANPAPVRQRALGRVVVQLSRTTPQPMMPRWVASRVRQSTSV